jgi:hypothetical protein
MCNWLVCFPDSSEQEGNLPHVPCSTTRLLLTLIIPLTINQQIDWGKGQAGALRADEATQTGLYPSKLLL